MTSRGWTLAVVCAATAMLMLDIAVVNTALSRIAEDLDPAAISAARQVVAHLTAQLRDLALQGPPDHGWSVPGPRPETTSAPQPAPTSGPQPLPQQAEEDA